MSWSKKVSTPRKDGRSLKSGQRDWNDIAAERIAKQETALARGENPFPERQCTGMTTGNWGPQRRCSNSAIRGGTVCRMHGGSLKHVRKAAEQRLLEQVDPTISRLVQLRDQENDLKVALGASTHLLNRVLGEKTGAGTAAPTHKLTIGLAIAGLPAQIIAKQQLLSSGSEDEDAVDGDVDDGTDGNPG